MGAVEIEPIFVVGYSRSGTKFVCNLLEKGSLGEVEHVGELHFFGRLSTDPQDKISAADAEIQLRKMALQYLRRKNCPFSSVDEIMSNRTPESRVLGVLSQIDVYHYFLSLISSSRGVSKICDGTPRNAYYIGEILDCFPNAKIIYMMRDPRDSVLSQKNKPKLVWSRGKKLEALRLALNYNPFFMAKFWQSSVRCLEKYKHDNRVFIVRYEEMLDRPKASLSSLSSFLELPRLEEFSQLVRVGNKDKFTEGLSKLEISAIEATASEELRRYSYSPSAASWLQVFSVPLSIIRFIAVAPLVYIFNFGRFSKALHEIKKRIFS